MDSGGGGLKHDWLKCPGVPPRFLQNLGRCFRAGAAASGNAEFALQVPDTFRAGLRGFANLLIGDSVADTDVHKFNTLGAFED